jgi:integrase
VNITVKVCSQKVAKQTKYFDEKCPGFYASVTPAGLVTFMLKFWNKRIGKQETVEISRCEIEQLAAQIIDAARADAEDKKSKIRRGLVDQIKSRHVQQKAIIAGATVDLLVDDFVAYISTKIKKPDGEMRARLESWKDVSGFLEREVRPDIGQYVVTEVTNSDIARIQKRIAKRSISGARQTRSAMIRMFKFGAEADNPYGLTTSPCHNLPKIDKEHPRTRVLDVEEIRTLWWGLDDPHIPCIRSVALAIKFELVSMLRTVEFRTARRSLIAGCAGSRLLHGTPVLRVPLKFVKKRRVIQQPLNSLAIEIVNEALASHNHDVIFSPRMLDPDVVLNRSALNHALNGKKGKTPRMGIIEYLGMKHFTPHDLRRTVATLAGDIGISDAEIAKCLDHAKGQGENVVEAPTVTGRVYVQSERLDQKRAVLDRIDAALRQIIGSPAVINRNLRRAA